MALILAIEPDRRQAAQLSQLVRTRVRADLVLAETTEGALGAIGNRVPDLILVPTFLSPQDDAALAGALRVIATAAHVNMLTIPVLADAVQAPKPTGLLARFRKQPEPVSTGCDPSVFAEQIKAYLAEAAAEEDNDAFEEDSTEPVQPIEEPAAPALRPGLEEKTYRGFTEITDARTLRQMLEAPSPKREEPRVAATPAPAPAPEPPAVVPPPAFDRPAVVEKRPVIEPPVVVTRPAVAEQPIVVEPPVEDEEPVITEPHRLVAPAFVRRRPVAEKPEVEKAEPSFAKPIEQVFIKPIEPVFVKPVEQVFVKPIDQVLVKPVEPPVVEPPVAEEPPVAVREAIERPVEKPAVCEPLDAPSLEALTEQFVDAEEPTAPVVEEVTPAIAEMVAALEEVAAPIERKEREHVEKKQEEEEEEDNDPIVLAIKHYVPKPLPQQPPPVPKPLPEPLAPAPRPMRAPAPAPAPVAAAPSPVAPAARVKTVDDAGAEPGLTQSDLDMLYFVEQGTLPPTAPAPRRKKPQRPEWGQLVAAVRVDVERMRAEGSEPAKRGQSGVRAAVGSTTPPPRKAPKPIQDQWGLFDPEQCGFAALLAKLEEITEAPEDTSAKV